VLGKIFTARLRRTEAEKNSSLGTTAMNAWASFLATSAGLV